MTHAQIRERFSKGLTQKEADEIFNTFGKCQTKVPVKPIINLLLEEFIGIFNVFQLLAIVLWCMDAYTFYAMVILAMTVVGIMIATYETRKNQNNLNSMSMYSCDVTMHRNYTKDEIESLILNHKQEVKYIKSLNSSLIHNNTEEIADFVKYDPENLYNQLFSYITNSE